MALTRLSDWQQRLVKTVNERRLMPYVYGRTDCACFVQAAVLAVTGTMLLAGVEKPKGWIGAAKFMLANGWEDVEQMATAVLGPPVSADLSRPGDVVSFELAEELHLAVRVGDAALTPAGEGLQVVDRLAWRNAWLVG